MEEVNEVDVKVNGEHFEMGHEAVGMVGFDDGELMGY